MIVEVAGVHFSTRKLELFHICQRYKGRRVTLAHLSTKFDCSDQVLVDYHILVIRLIFEMFWATVSEGAPL